MKKITFFFIFKLNDKLGKKMNCQIVNGIEVHFPTLIKGIQITDIQHCTSLMD